MGMCVNGVWWFVLPNLPEMEEAAESAEEEKDLMQNLEFSSEFYFWFENFLLKYITQKS